MLTSSMTHQLRRFRLLGVFLLVMTLAVPASLYAGIVFIPAGGFKAKNAQGDRLVVLVRGDGPDLSGMEGRARFRDGTSGQWTEVTIASSTHAAGSSNVVFYDVVSIAVVELDLTEVSMTWLATGTTFVSGVDKMTLRLKGRSRVTSD